MTATLEDLVRRVADLGEGSVGTDADMVTGHRGTRSVSQELFEVERSLTEAVRRLRALTEALRHPGATHD